MLSFVNSGQKLYENHFIKLLFAVTFYWYNAALQDDQNRYNGFEVVEISRLRGFFLNISGFIRTGEMLDVDSELKLPKSEHCESFGSLR